MADDFGDDAGDKLLDWSIRIMVERGRHHAYASSSKLAGALRNAQGRVMESSGAPMPEAVEREGWAKLDLHEFTGIDGWNDLKEIMDKDLVARGIVHEWFEDASDGKAIPALPHGRGEGSLRCVREPRRPRGEGP